jgi:hypothetical protein
MRRWKKKFRFFFAMFRLLATRIKGTYYYATRWAEREKGRGAKQNKSHKSYKQKTQPCAYEKGCHKNLAKVFFVVVVVDGGWGVLYMYSVIISAITAKNFMGFELESEWLQFRVMIKV